MSSLPSNVLSNVAAGITEAQAIGDEILTTIEGAVPGAAAPAALAQTILDLAAKYAAKALTAWSAASQTPITSDSVASLMPNSTPLTPPTS